MSGSTSTSTVPAAAAAAGYDLQTFGPAVTLDSNWFRWAGNPSAVNVTPNSDGSVTINGGGNSYNDQLESHATFGGGGYFQATMSFPNNPAVNGGGWPSFWSNTAGDNQANNIEVDTVEVQGQNLTHGTIDWANGGIATSTSGNVAQPFPAGTDFSQPHTYGMLWIPGQALTFYFDGKQLPDSTSLAAGSPYSVLDQQHLNLILGTGPDNPMTVYNVQVWQNSAANDLSLPSVPVQSSPAPTVAPPSQDNTVVMAGSTAAITDASGNSWTITSGGQVAVNGVTDTITSGVVELAYEKGTIWQENSAKLWWGETAPNGSWSISPATTTSPVPPPPPPSPDNTVVMAGSTAAIVDASGNKWSITSGGQVAVNGVADTITSGVVELAYEKGTIWQENSAKLWWGETAPNGSWSISPATAVSPVPVPVTPSQNYTIVMAGSTAAITDASGNKWSITSGGQVAVNGVADTMTGQVKELAYVGQKIWQENAANLWWDKAKPTDAWGPTSGTATSPLPTSIVIPSTTTSMLVNLSHITVTATTGDHMVFLTGQGDTVTLTGGKESIGDSGKGDTYVLPAAGKGFDTFTNNVLAASDVLDLRPALAATTWNGNTATIGNYLHVTDTAQGAVIGVSMTSGGPATSIAGINAATTASLTTLMAHAIV